MPADARGSGGRRAVVAGVALAAFALLCFAAIRAARSSSHAQDSRPVEPAEQEHREAAHVAEPEVSEPQREARHVEPQSETTTTTGTKEPKSEQAQTTEAPAEDANETQQSDNSTDCEGSTGAACECIMTCPIFGGDPAKCQGKGHSEKRGMVDEIIAKTITSHHDMCKGMRCIKACATELGCLDEKVRGDCLIVERSYEENRVGSDPKCRLYCDE